jgi:hypothetical protein
MRLKNRRYHSALDSVSRVKAVWSLVISIYLRPPHHLDISQSGSPKRALGLAKITNTFKATPSFGGVGECRMRGIGLSISRLESSSFFLPYSSSQNRE